MTRAPLVWGGAAAGIVGLGGLALALALSTTATAADHVQRYLDALARDDLAAVARLAGLEAPTAMPLGDDGEPSIHRVVSSAPDADGGVTVVAEYGSETDAVTVRFRLEPAPPTLGLVPAWAFAQPPVTTLSVAADQHDRLVANERVVVAEVAGQPVDVTAFVPARITVRITDPLLRADPVTVRAGATGDQEVELVVAPGDRLERLVAAEVEHLLIACAEQPVLQPTGCPFGIEIIDRVTAPPVWRLEAAPEVIVEPGEDPGVWRVRGEGSVRLTVTLQRLFDGLTVERDEQVAFVVRGDVVLDPAGPVLTIYPPGV
ncbi:hypothetical protein [Microcella sp.]|uniref:hypothetical protein n=1 Tax=Microcella sp. TaxID=1913979 RepID=UPI003F72C262